MAAAPAKAEAARYTHGHDASVLQSHKWRTAANSAGYLLPHLKSTDKILDLGCGPGTITIDLAAYVPQGHITGLDSSADVIAQAQTAATAQGISNLTYSTGDANALPYADGEFDVVVCHQLLQHVSDPVGILAEMKRVCRSGGIVAARESDYSVFTWYPASEPLDRWRNLYLRVARQNGGEPDAGRMLHAWAKKAGLKDIKCSVSAWCYATEAEVRWWSESWAGRVSGPNSSLAKTAISSGLATKAEIDALAAGWREWGQHPDAWFSVPSGEILCINS